MVVTMSHQKEFEVYLLMETATDVYIQTGLVVEIKDDTLK